MRCRQDLAARVGLRCQRGREAREEAKKEQEKKDAEVAAEQARADQAADKLKKEQEELKAYKEQAETAQARSRMEAERLRREVEDLRRKRATLRSEVQLEGQRVDDVKKQRVEPTLSRPSVDEVARTSSPRWPRQSTHPNSGFNKLPVVVSCFLVSSGSAQFPITASSRTMPSALRLTHGVLWTAVAKPSLKLDTILPLSPLRLRHKLCNNNPHRHHSEHRAQTE